MKTPAQIKAWLGIPMRRSLDAMYKRETLEYIQRLENIVALYTQRDGKLEYKQTPVRL